MANLREMPNCLLLLGFFLAFLGALYAVGLCSYAGPDTSGDGLQLTDFSLSAHSSNLSIGDEVKVSFYLKNAGGEAINLTDKGIYVAVRDKDGGNHDFGHYMKNQVLAANERVKFEQSFEISENGLWSVWPAYEIWKTAYSAPLGKYITMKVSSPLEWHTCEVGACPDYCEDGTHYYGGYIGQGTECIDYKEEECKMGCDEEGIFCAATDDEDPEVSITESPPEPTAVSNITFTAIATDNVDVARIAIYVDGRVRFECTPPQYFERDGYWQCTWEAGTFPAGTLRYKARAFDSVGNSGTSEERILEIAPLMPSIEPETVSETASGELRCSISGILYDFKYYSKTLAVNACEAETVGGGCSPTPPYACTQPITRCKSGGHIYNDTNLTRIWAGEEAYMSPGPMAYQISVPCNRSYLLEPVYQPYGEECRWGGSWRVGKGNFVPSTEVLASGYDFYFEPMELNPPSITEVNYLLGDMDSMYRYLFQQSSAKFAGVKAYDGSGIQKIKVNATFTAVGFVSDENGPLEGYAGPNRTMFYNIMQECNGSSACNFTFARPPLNPPEFTAIEVSVRVRACDNAGNSVSGNYNKTYVVDGSGGGNLRIDSIEPVQVVYGAPLVERKATAFRVKISSTYKYPVEAKLGLGLPEGEWDLVSGTGNLIVARAPGWRYREVWGPIKIPANANRHAIILPIIPGWKEGENGTDSGQVIRGSCIGGICGPDVRAMPVPISGNVSFSVRLDPGNELQEANESDNLLESGKYEVVGSRPMKIYYAVHAGGNVPGHEQALGHINGTDVECWRRGVVQTRDEICNKAKALAKRTTEYLLGVAPIADSKISYVVDCMVRDEANYSDYTGTMLAMAEENGFDYMLSFEACDCCGACAPGVSGCGIGLWGEATNGAHELLSHGISRFGEECYDCKPDDCDRDSGGNLVNCTAVACDACGASEGFWVNEWKAYGNGSKYPYRPPTYYADAVLPENAVWQRLDALWSYDGRHELPGGYLTLIDRLQNENDPMVLLVRGQIHKNGSAEFEPFVVLENGTPNLAEGEKGAYYVVLLDQYGNVVGKAGFDASFYLMAPEGRKELERASFVYRMEWKEGVASIRLEDGRGRVLANRQVSLNSPEVKMLYPNGGETFALGETIKAKWEGSDKDNDPLTYSLAISSDGKAWLPIGIDIRGNEYDLDTSWLEEGKYFLRVRATDGVNAAEDISDRVFAVGIPLAGEKPSVPPAANISAGEETPAPEAEKEQPDYLLFGILAAAVVVVGIWLLKGPNKRKG